jgi:chorismate synthase
MGSSLGQLFRISTFGESHGGGVGVIVDGCPPRLPIDREAIQAELDRRRPGQSRITTPRKEDDRVEILSGLLDGLTLGTPIAMLVRNKDQRPQDYQEMEVAFRPSHADATYQAKYGIQARSGGGRASARETIGRVAAGAIAKQLLAHVSGTEVIAWVKRIHTIEASIDPASVSLEAVEANIVRCPDGTSAERMIERIEAIGRDGDSCGGVIECLVRRPPLGLGMPVFDKLEADRLGVRWHAAARKRAQRCLPAHGRWPPAHRHQQLRRHPGRHQQRRADPDSGGLQAHRHDPQAAAND